MCCCDIYRLGLHLMRNKACLYQVSRNIICWIVKFSSFIINIYIYNIWYFLYKQHEYLINVGTYQISANNGHTGSRANYLISRPILEELISWLSFQSLSSNTSNWTLLFVYIFNSTHFSDSRNGSSHSSKLRQTGRSVSLCLPVILCEHVS